MCRQKAAQPLSLVSISHTRLSKLIFFSFFFFFYWTCLENVPIGGTVEKGMMRTRRSTNHYKFSLAHRVWIINWSVYWMSFVLLTIGFWTLEATLSRLRLDKVLITLLNVKFSHKKTFLFLNKREDYLSLLELSVLCLIHRKRMKSASTTRIQIR